MSTEGDALGDAIRTGIDAAVAPPAVVDRPIIFRAMGNAIWDAESGYVRRIASCYGAIGSGSTPISLAFTRLAGERITALVSAWDGASIDRTLIRSGTGLSVEWWFENSGIAADGLTGWTLKITNNGSRTVRYEALVIGIMGLDPDTEINSENPWRPAADPAPGRHAQQP